MSDSDADQVRIENGGRNANADRKINKIARTFMTVQNWLVGRQLDESIENSFGVGRLVKNDGHFSTSAKDLTNDVDNFGNRIRRTALTTVNGASAAYYLWTFLMAIACFYNLLSIVVLASFPHLNVQHKMLWLISDLFSDIVYLIDILIESRKVYMQNGMIVTEPRLLLKNYRKSCRFWLDISSIVPLNLISLLVFDTKLPLIRVNRLIRCYRIGDFVEKTELRSSIPNAFKIVKLVVAILVIFHWNACFYFIASSKYKNDDSGLLAWTFSYAKIQNPIIPTCDAWRNRKQCIFDESNYSDAEYRSDYKHQLEDFWSIKSETIRFTNLTRQYTLSFYWSALTLTNIGEQGLLVFATIVGNVGNVVSNMNARKAELEDCLDSVKQFMEYRDLDAQVRKRIIGWFSYVAIQDQTFDEQAILNSLPSKLQEELAIHVHLNTLHRVKLFQDCEPGLLHELVLKLKLQVFSPNDYICRKGDEMYIVKRGSLNVVSDDGNIIFVTLKEGSVFGELSILDIPDNINGNKRTAAVRAVGFVDLFVLSKDDLWDALREYPEAKRLLIDKGKELLNKDGLLLTNYNKSIVGPRKTLEQRLEYIEYQTVKITKDMDRFYEHISKQEDDMKQQVSMLETIFKVNRKQIRHDIVFSVLDKQ